MILQLFWSIFAILEGCSSIRGLRYFSTCNIVLRYSTVPGHCCIQLYHASLQNSLMSTISLNTYVVETKQINLLTLFELNAVISHLLVSGFTSSKCLMLRLRVYHRIYHFVGNSTTITLKLTDVIYKVICYWFVAGNGHSAKSLGMLTW